MDQDTPRTKTKIRRMMGYMFSDLEAHENSLSETYEFSMSCWLVACLE